MKSTEELRAILSQHKEKLKQRYKVKAIGIFGSFVRDEQHEDSDVDILVEFERPIGFFRFLELEEHLCELLGAKVDLVSKKALRPYIGRAILQEVVPV